MKKQIQFVVIIVIVIMITMVAFPGDKIIQAQGLSEQPEITMMLFETDLRESLNEISLQAGVNIIPDQTVNGVVTADLKSVPLEKALRLVLIGGGYTYRKIEDFYLIGLPDPKSNTFRELSEVEVIKLKHIIAKKAFDILPSFLSYYVKGDPRDSILTINAPPRELERIKEMIDKLDQPQKKVEVKVVVTEINSEKVRELGTNLLQYEEGAGANEKIIYGKNNDNDLTGEDLLVIEDEFYGKLLTTLKLLKEEKKAEIKAGPRILVADGESAKLFIGDSQVLLLTSEDNDFTSRVEKVEVGVGLQVKADIISENEINLKLEPEISHFVDEQRPDLVVKRNSVSTTLRLRNGQTAILAGMTLEDSSSYNKGIPILKDIPLVRWLFSNQTTRKANRELLIFVTPVIR